MEIRYEIIEQAEESSANAIRDRLRAYNLHHWEVKERRRYVIEAHDSAWRGGIVFTVFGNWLEIEFLWIDEAVRGRGVGTELLRRAEEIGLHQGCRYSSLNTMSFQARPFYEAHGYTVKHVQEHYPKTSTKYFLEKRLMISQA